MLVIGNGRMITQDASNPFLENGAVAMDGNTIVMVGVTEEVKKVYPDAEFVDAKGGVIMPAFINAHEHIYSSFARGLSINGYNPQGFLDILDGLWCLTTMQALAILQVPSMRSRKLRRI